ncbi:elongation factor P--(R)-beta-lysine ligase, partial [Leptospira sp. 96542]|nr:elongation factor P--(R)-beta-lysine ligase [Leptospira sp. 96542]
MHTLPKEILIFRANVLKLIRKLLWEKDFIEVDSPCLKPVVGMEPYLDPFLVTSPDGKEKGYL